MVSEYKERSIKRRDERHTTLEIRKPSGSKKDTKKWCRGVVGREHQLKCKPDRRITEWYNLVCTECGKHIAYYYWPSQFPTEAGPKPDWVKEGENDG